MDDSRKLKRADEIPQKRHKRKKREPSERKAKEEEKEKIPEISLDKTNWKDVEGEKKTR